jgi:hypothetical protein
VTTNKTCIGLETLLLIHLIWRVARILASATSRDTRFAGITPEQPVMALAAPCVAPCACHSDAVVSTDGAYVQTIHQHKRGMLHTHTHARICIQSVQQTCMRNACVCVLHVPLGQEQEEPWREREREREKL